MAFTTATLVDNPCNIVSPLLPENFLSSELRKTVFSGKTRSEKWRRLQLKRLKQLTENHQAQILLALKHDMGKPATEGFFELIAVRQELKLAEQELTRWMRPKKISVPISFKPGEAHVLHEPIGCVLIIGPWNYPFSLTFQPLVSALAAGNTAVLKPSENAPATSELIATLVPKYFPSDVVNVFQGDGLIAAELLKQPFDHIFFTGGGNIAKKVMAAAAENLTPVTLELGGKSPAIILEGADLKVTARRLIWGKGLNAGQTCIAPNHLFVQQELIAPLLTEMKKARTNFYGSNPTHSKDLARIINSHHFSRLKTLLEAARQKQQILLGGEIDVPKRLIAPSILEIKNSQDPLMEEELFGPLLPMLPISSFESALQEIRQQPKPLALYMFGGNNQQQEQLLNTTSSGGVCFNDVVMQAGIPELPFGGVGASGIGHYHGKAGFTTFSHTKSILRRPFWLDLEFRYPPYKLDISFLKKILG